MPASVAHYDYWVAERAADLLAGDNPGLIVWVVEVWHDSGRYEEGLFGDLHLAWDTDWYELKAYVDRMGVVWERQYDATKQKEAADG
jgi:hypothetical protein